MTRFEFSRSSYSENTTGSECVEVAVNVPGIVAVRDSKDPHRELIRVSPQAWAAFLGAGGGVSG
ncbi:DUF397 domain-containing protein [Streptomyces sp. NPDC101118]|uniref:DUF397 domain-containing protein n=1 Tax=Streptomyces sp. NPDC101118 TaxID=3366109 RepID=UPI003820B679